MLKKGIVITTAVCGLLLVLIWSGYHNDILNFLSVNFLGPQPDFEISANPRSITLHNSAGSSNATIITVRSINGFNASIAFKLEVGLILDEIDFSLDPDQVYLQSDGEAHCVLALYVPSLITQKEYHIEVVGNAGKLEHSVHITITVYP